MDFKDLARTYERYYNIEQLIVKIIPNMMDINKDWYQCFINFLTKSLVELVLLHLLIQLMEQILY